MAVQKKKEKGWIAIEDSRRRKIIIELSKNLGNSMPSPCQAYQALFNCFITQRRIPHKTSSSHKHQFSQFNQTCF